MKTQAGLEDFFGGGHYWAQFPGTEASDHQGSAITYLETLNGECIDSGETESWLVSYDPKTLAVEARIEVRYAEFEKTGPISTISLRATGKVEYSKKWETHIFIIESVVIEEGE